MDIYWRDAVQCPSEEEYKTMVIRSRFTVEQRREKTGLLGVRPGLTQTGLYSLSRKLEA